MTISRPHDAGRDGDLLVRYLLGQLPPQETERIDEASVADDDMAARLLRAEDDLVDAYVRGSLSGETLTQFESHYLSSPRRRARVSFASRFLPAVDRAAAVAAPVVRAPSRLRLMSIIAVAATLLLIAGGALLIQTVRLERGLRVSQSEKAALDARARELEQQLAELRADNAAARKELERSRTPVAPAAPGISTISTIALVLAPQTRSIGPIPAVAIRAGTDRVGFELRLESNDFPRYQVGLKDPAVNTIVWRSGWLAATSSAGEPAVRVVVPADLLKPQHYGLDLSGGRGSGPAEVVGSYTFEVLPR